MPPTHLLRIAFCLLVSPSQIDTSSEDPSVTLTTQPRYVMTSPVSQTDNRQTHALTQACVDMTCVMTSQTDNWQKTSALTKLSVDLNHMTSQTNICEDSVSTSSGQTLIQQVTHCQTESIAMIGDRHGSPYPTLYRKLQEYVTSSSIPLLHLEVLANISMRDDITNVILRRELENYEDRRLSTIYILFSSMAGRILIDVEKGFLEHSRRSGSLFPHRSKWLIFVTSQSQKLELIQDLKKSVLDNIAVVVYSRCTINEGMSEIWLPEIVTLMWREHRTRKPQEVKMEDTKDSTDCVLFPNIYFGLNQRKLTAITGLPGLTFERQYNKTSKSYTYAGHMVRILGNISEHLNFTYDLWPSADDFPRKRSEDDILHSVENREFDIGAELWLYGEISRFNVSFTYPAVFDRYVGLHKLKINTKNMELLIACPFKPTTFVMIGGSILYCICFYMAIRLVLCTRHIDEDVGHKLEIDQSNPDTESPGDGLVSPNQQLSQILTLITSILQSFIWGQYFPRPLLMSSRIVLCLMSLSTGLYYTLYTGVLTATMTSDPSNNQYKTWTDLLENEGYKCRILTETFSRNYLKQETKVRIDWLADVSKHCSEDFSYEPETPRMSNLLHYMDENEIVIYYHITFEHHLRLMRYEHHERYVIIPQALMNLNRGFIFPLPTELEKIFSMTLMRIHETRPHVLDPYAFTQSGKNITSLANERSRRGLSEFQDRIVMGDIKWLVVVTASLTLLSSLVLVAECIFACIQFRRAKVKYHHDN